MSEPNDTWEKDRDQLIADCPLLFRGREGFYFEIMAGWHVPVRKACLALERIAERTPAPTSEEEPDLRPRVGQIKEKFGGLRLYLRGAHSDESRAITEEAEKACESLCEVCGAEGRRREDHKDYGPVCEDHIRKRKNGLG